VSTSDDGEVAVRAATDWPAPRLVPTTYPGAAPDHHYLLVDDRVVPLVVESVGDRLSLALADGTAVDDVLARAGLAPLADRVPMLAYGANRVPHTLAVKFAHHGYRNPEGTVAVPVLAGSVAGLDVVAAGLSSQGFVYADLAPSPGTRVSAMLTLLDRDQAAAVHESEGVGRAVYDCAWLPGFTVAGTSRELDVLAYAGCQPVFVSPATGSPLAFSAIAATGRRLVAYPQVELLAHVLATTGLVGAVADLVGLPLGDAGEPGEADETGGTGPAGQPGEPDRSGGTRPAGQPGKPVAVALELVRLLSGQWWYVHNTGDVPMAVAARAFGLVAEAFARHRAERSTSERLAARGAVLAADVVHAAGPELRLGAQVDLG
jgi:hypothetical protein